MPTLAEDLVLLAITEKGDVASGAQLRLDNGVAGAHLMELALRGRVELRDDVVVMADASPTGDGPLDAVLAEIADAEPRPPKDWITPLAGRGSLEPVVQGLRAQGVLTEQRGKVLGIFNRTRNVEADPEPERAARARLHAALVEGGDLDARTAALASLVGATELMGEVFPDAADRQAADDRMAALGGDGGLGAALGAANQASVNAMLAAVMVSVTAAVTASTAAVIATN